MTTRSFDVLTVGSPLHDATSWELRSHFECNHPGAVAGTPAYMSPEQEELKKESGSQVPAPAGAATVKRRSRRWWMAWAAAGFLVLAAAAMLLFSSSPNADRAEAVAVLPEMRGDGLLRDVDGVAVVDHVDLSGNRDRHRLGLA